MVQPSLRMTRLAGICWIHLLKFWQLGYPGPRAKGIYVRILIVWGTSLCDTNLPPRNSGIRSTHYLVPIKSCGQRHPYIPVWWQPQKYLQLPQQSTSRSISATFRSNAHSPDCMGDLHVRSILSYYVYSI